MPVLASNFPKGHSVSVRGMLTLTSAVAGATLICLATVSGSYALWSTSADLDAGIIASGSLTLKVDHQDHVEFGTDLAHMLPGDQLRKTIELSNVGTVGAEVTAITRASSELEVRFLQGTCAAPNSVSTEDSNGTRVSLGNLAKGTDSTLCLEVTLLPSAAAPNADDLPLKFSLTFSATQKI